MKVIEITGATLSIIGLLLKIVHLPGGDISLVIGLGLLSCLYFYLGWAYFNGIGLRKLFKAESYRNLKPKKLALTVFAGMVLSTASIGFLFQLLHFPGADVMLVLGSTGCAIVLILIVALLKNVRHNNKAVIIRLGIFFLFILIFLF